MRDPYVVLGISQSASQKDVKAAFRRLAKRYHPDQNPDNPGAKERFAEASAAYEIIGDKKKREQFDRGEIGSDGKEKFADFTAWNGQKGKHDSPFVNAFSSAQRQYGGEQGFRVDMGGAEDILKDLFGATFGSRTGHQNTNSGAYAHSPDQPAKAGNIKLKTGVSIKDLACGKTSVLFPNGRKISISIPPEAGNGQVIRLKGQGKKQPGAIPGDALVTLVIEQNGKFEVNGTDIRVEVKLPLKTAVKGGQITIDAPGGEISLRTPAWTTSGRVFRLKGKGLPRKGGGMGDLLVRVIITLPEEPDEQLENLFNG